MKLIPLDLREPKGHPLLNHETAEQIKRWREEDRRRGIVWIDEQEEENDRANQG